LKGRQQNFYAPSHKKINVPYGNLRGMYRVSFWGIGKWSMIGEDRI
jgi:hypothetical protein